LSLILRIGIAEGKNPDDVQEAFKSKLNKIIDFLGKQEEELKELFNALVDLSFSNDKKNLYVCLNFKSTSNPVQEALQEIEGNLSQFIDSKFKMSASARLGFQLNLKDLLLNYCTRKLPFALLEGLHFDYEVKANSNYLDTINKLLLEEG